MKCLEKNQEFHYNTYVKTLSIASYTGLEKMIATPSRAKMVVVRERLIPYSDSTSKKFTKKVYFNNHNEMVRALIEILIHL
jgi:hypothetical protein